MFIISVVHDLHNLDDHLKKVNNILIDINCLSIVTTDSRPLPPPPPPLSCFSISNNYLDIGLSLALGSMVEGEAIERQSQQHGQVMK
jgi:hypothetical protein